MSTFLDKIEKLLDKKKAYAMQGIKKPRAKSVAKAAKKTKVCSTCANSRKPKKRAGPRVSQEEKKAAKSRVTMRKQHKGIREKRARAAYIESFAAPDRVWARKELAKASAEPGQARYRLMLGLR